LEALVARLLAKDPAARPASAEELSELLAAALGDAPATAVGGKRSDPPGRARTPLGAREARVRAALAGGIVGALALAAILVALARPKHEAPKERSTPTATVTAPTTAPMTAPTTAPTTAHEATVDDPRTTDELEHEFLSMKSALSARDRRAALRAVYARIDAGGGSAPARAQKKRDALIELIRQHAN